MRETGKPINNLTKHPRVYPNVGWFEVNKPQSSMENGELSSLPHETYGFLRNIPKLTHQKSGSSSSSLYSHGHFHGEHRSISHFPTKVLPHGLELLEASRVKDLAPQNGDLLGEEQILRAFLRCRSGGRTPPIWE